MRPLQTLLDISADSGFYPFPTALTVAYGGGLGFREPILFANFVATLDGVVAIDELEHVGQIISGGSEGDRFMMGLLRACADTVLIGAGTLRASPDSVWTPEAAWPEAASDYARLRAGLGRAPLPRLAVVTASGGIDLTHPGLAGGALILTSELGRRRLPGRLPDGFDVEVLGEDRVELTGLKAALLRQGKGVVLSEAGPNLMGQMLERGLVDELFLTLSPLIAGGPAGSRRPGLAAGASLLPQRQMAARLISVRRQDQHLFLRYDLGSASTLPCPGGHPGKRPEPQGGAGPLGDYRPSHTSSGPVGLVIGSAPWSQK